MTTNEFPPGPVEDRPYGPGGPAGTPPPVFDQPEAYPPLGAPPSSTDENLPPSGGYPTGTQASSAESSSTPDVAKEQAAGVAQSAADAGQRVAGTAKEQTQQVAEEAGRQAKDLLEQTRAELADQAGAQKQRAASNLHALGDELGSMADGSEQNGVATDLVRQAASRSHDVASWLDGREPGHLVDEIRNFARRRPGTFLALAAGAGLLAGRLTRGIKEDAGSGDGSSSSSSSLSSASPTTDSTGAGYGTAGAGGAGVPSGAEFGAAGGALPRSEQRPEDYGARL